MTLKLGMSQAEILAELGHASIPEKYPLLQILLSL